MQIGEHIDESQWQEIEGEEGEGKLQMMESLNEIESKN